MHADLHPGNILVRSSVRGWTQGGCGASASSSGSYISTATANTAAVEGKKGSFHSTIKPRPTRTNSSTTNSGSSRSNSKIVTPEYSIVMVDAGMVARLTPLEQQNFIGLLTAMGDGDGAAAARFILAFAPHVSSVDTSPSGATTVATGGESQSHERGHHSSQSSSSSRVHSGPYSSSTRASFTADMVTLFRVSCRGYRHETDLGQVLRGILSLCRTHHISIPANYATLVMNALCLDGMAKALLPDYNVLDGAEILLKMNKIVSRVPVPFLRRWLLPIAYFFKRRHDAKFATTAISTTNTKK